MVADQYLGRHYPKRQFWDKCRSLRGRRVVVPVARRTTACYGQLSGVVAGTCIYRTVIHIAT